MKYVCPDVTVIVTFEARWSPVELAQASSLQPLVTSEPVQVGERT